MTLQETTVKAHSLLAIPVVGHMIIGGDEVNWFRERFKADRCHTVVYSALQENERHVGPPAVNGFFMVFLDNSSTLPFRSDNLRARPFGGRSAGMISMQERWLSVEGIAAHLGVSPETIHKWIPPKKMPAHRLGRLRKFLASEVDGWVKGGHVAEDVLPAIQTATAKRKLRSPKTSAYPDQTGHPRWGRA